MRASTYSYAHVNGRPVNASATTVGALVMAFLLLVGGIFAGVGTILKKHDAKVRERCTDEVNALVTDYKTNGNGLRSPLYEYEYKGKTYTFHTNTYSTDPPYSKGDSAELLVNPDKPEEAFVPADETADFLSTLFQIMGFGVMGIGVIVFLMIYFISRKAAQQQRRKEEPWLQ